MSEEQKYNIELEYFPYPQSCPQECKCQLAYKGGVNPNVEDFSKDAQKSFMSFMEASAHSREKFSFTYAGLLSSEYIESIPMFNEAMLVTRFRCSLGKITSIMTSRQVQEKVDALVLFYVKLAKKQKTYFGASICISFSVENVVPSKNDYQTLKKILANFLVGMESRITYFKYELEMRSNDATFEEFSNSVMEIPKRLSTMFSRLLKTVIHKKVNIPVMGSKSEFKVYPVDSFSCMHYSAFEAYDPQKNLVKITHRVLARYKKVTKNKTFIDEAIEVYQKHKFDGKHWLNTSLGCSSEGIILWHISKYIKNPTHWMSHEDFRREVQIRIIDGSDTIFSFIERIYLENLYMMVHFAQKESSYKKTMDIFFEKRPEVRYGVIDDAFFETFKKLPQ